MTHWFWVGFVATLGAWLAVCVILIIVLSLIAVTTFIRLQFGPSPGPYRCQPCTEGRHHSCSEPGVCQCTINPDTGEDEAVDDGPRE